MLVLRAEFYGRTGGPSQIRCHIDPAIMPRTIRACKPGAEWKEQHTAVLAELRRRQGVIVAAAEAEAEKEKVKAEGRLMTASKHFGVVMPDEVAEAWLKLVVKRALPLDLFDDEAFRAAIVTTAKCVKQMYPKMGKANLPHRFKVTKKILPPPAVFHI